MPSMQLTLPYPPSLNSYYRTWKGRILISRDGLAYRQVVAAEVMAARAAMGLCGRLGVHIDVYPTDRRRRDLDNVLKCTLDSLSKAGVFLDDEQIDALSLERKQVEKPGRIVVSIEEL